MFRGKPGLASEAFAWIAFIFIIGLNAPILAAGTCSSATRSQIGWEGDDMGAIAYHDGSLFIRALGDVTVGFNIFNNPTAFKWYNHSGYLPCLVTEFERDDCTVKIMNFGDEVYFNNNRFILAYCRIQVYNHGSVGRDLSPGAYGSFTTLSSPGTYVNPGETVNHDLAIPIDRFAQGCNWPSNSEIQAAGSWDTHFYHMQQHWDAKLNTITVINQIPDEDLADAYRAGFIYVHIIRDDVFGQYQHRVGEWCYDGLYSHDTVGILAWLLSIGDFHLAKERMMSLHQDDSGYPDSFYKYAWIYALYLLKTGDIDHINQQFDTIKEVAHRVAANRTGPNGVMRESWGVG